MSEQNNAVEAARSGNAPVRPVPPATATNRTIMWAATFVVLIILVAVVGWWSLPPELHGIQLQSPRVAEDFTLLTSTGEEMSLSDFRGKYVVLFFGYTFCPDVCPTTLNDLKLMAAALGEERAQDVQVILVSVDPERDTPERLAEYLAFFDPTFIGMTGTVEQIQPVASQFGIYFEKHEGSANTNYLVDHTGSLTLIDPEGRVSMVFSYGTKGADIATDISYLMRRG